MGYWARCRLLGRARIHLDLCRNNRDSFPYCNAFLYFRECTIKKRFVVDCLLWMGVCGPVLRDRAVASR